MWILLSLSIFLRLYSCSWWISWSSFMNVELWVKVQEQREHPSLAWSQNSFKGAEVVSFSFTCRNILPKKTSGQVVNHYLTGQKNDNVVIMLFFFFPISSSPSFFMNSVLSWHRWPHKYSEWMINEYVQVLLGKWIYFKVQVQSKGKL